jgi:hypothetical protein
MADRPEDRRCTDGSTGSPQRLAEGFISSETAKTGEIVLVRRSCAEVDDLQFGMAERQLFVYKIPFCSASVIFFYAGTFCIVVIGHWCTCTLKRNTYEPYISDVVIREIEATRDSVLQKKLVDHINAISPIVLQTDEEIEALTDLYMKTGFAAADSIRVYNDCSHVAIATVNEIRHIVSFNCKHLVNDKRIDAFNAINFQNGYELVIDITTPHRFLFDAEQENIWPTEKHLKKSGLGVKLLRKNCRVFRVKTGPDTLMKLLWQPAKNSALNAGFCLPAHAWKNPRRNNPACCSPQVRPPRCRARTAFNKRALPAQRLPWRWVALRQLIRLCKLAGYDDSPIRSSSLKTQRKTRAVSRCTEPVEVLRRLRAPPPNVCHRHTAMSRVLTAVL